MLSRGPLLGLRLIASSPKARLTHYLAHERDGRKR